MRNINQINERIKHLRSLLKLSQDEFGQKIGIVRSGISNYEKGTREITNQVFLSICREFNVSEEWLRNGVGEIFVESDQQVVDEFLKTHNLNEKALTIVNGFLSLSEKERNLFVDTFYKIIKDYKVEEEQHEPVSTLKIVEDIETDFVPVPLYDINVSAGLGNYLDGSVKPQLVTFKLNSRQCKADHALYVKGDSMQPLIMDNTVIFIKEQPALESGEVGVFIYDGEVYCKRLILEGKKVILRSENKNYDDIVVNKDFEFITVGKVLT